MTTLTTKELDELEKLVMELPKRPTQRVELRPDNVLALISAARDGLNARWRPIEEAPKDGARILAWSPQWSAPATVQWYGSFWSFSYGMGALKHQPTHFQPLPTPPERGK